MRLQTASFVQFIYACMTTKVVGRTPAGEPGAVCRAHCAHPAEPATAGRPGWASGNNAQCSGWCCWQSGLGHVRAAPAKCQHNAAAHGQQAHCFTASPKCQCQCNVDTDGRATHAAAASHGTAADTCSAAAAAIHAKATSPSNTLEATAASSSSSHPSTNRSSCSTTSAAYSCGGGGGRRRRQRRR